MASIKFTSGGITSMSISSTGGTTTFVDPPECLTNATMPTDLANKATVDAAVAGAVGGTDNFFTYKSGSGTVDTSGFMFIKGTGVACTNALTTGVETAGTGAGVIEMFNTQNNNNPPIVNTYKNVNGGATASGTTLFLQRMHGRNSSGIVQAATITCSQTRPVTGGGLCPSDLRFAVQNDLTGTTQVAINPATSIEGNTGSLTINNVAGYWMGFGSIAGSNQTGIIRSTSASLGLVVNTATVMRITEAGRVGIGILSPTTFQFQISQDSAAKPTTNTWTISSDQRIKKAIESADLHICYDNIRSLKLRRFEWDPEYYDDTITKDRHALGFIAQEVKEKFPKAVIIEPVKEFEIKKDGITETKTLENFHSLNTDQIDKSHIGATQMLMKKVEELEAKLAAMAEQVAALERTKCTCTECEMRDFVRDM